MIVRLVIEVTEAERTALASLLVALGNPTYSQLFRVLMRLSIDQSIPHKLILKAIQEPRPVINVTLQRSPGLQQLAVNSAPTPQEQQQMAAYMESHGLRKLSVERWRKLKD